MSNTQQPQPQQQQEETPQNDQPQPPPPPPPPLQESSSEFEYSSSDSDSDSDSDIDLNLDNNDDTPYYPRRPGEFPNIRKDDYSEEANIQRFTQAMRFARLRKKPRKQDTPHQQYDFPYDSEEWDEQDLMEFWADAPLEMTKPGWDPAFADDEDWEVMNNEVKQWRDPPIAPFYLPYRKPYPVVPDNHYDISTPFAVVEELDRIEEFMRWCSYIFPDGSSYEGTVWDDLAHGKGVYVAEQGLVRYEGEWLQNQQEGHGVVEVEVPDVEPVPGSKLEAQMRAEGKIIKRDYLNQEDREWLEMDIEDSLRLTNGNYEIPWYEKDEWIRQYGKKPEKGRYRYAGQWKHGRMHGCGIYEVNERPIFGRFYFGELLDDPTGCDEGISAMHAGIAEVAAAKARMFVNKPDGMVREERGPYGDPQHPYFYEEEDVWQAPGFINQFYEVPDYWKTYMQEVDQEREMWLNSFYKAPLRLPMPAELEHWWERDRFPEFVLINKEPEPDPNDPSKLIYTEDPVILHTPTGQVINYVDDEKHGLRLFWQPPLDEGEDVDPTKVNFLPLGFDEFYGRQEVVKKEGFLKRFICSIEKACKPWFENLEKWTEEQKKESEMRKKLLEAELELVEAELELEEALEDMEEALKQQEKEAEKKLDMQSEEEDVIASPVPVEEEQKILPKKEIEDDDEEDEEEEEEDDSAPSSFGSVEEQKDKKNGSGRSPFSTLSLASSGLLSMVPSMVDKSFSVWKKARSPPKFSQASGSSSRGCMEYSHLVTFHQAFPENMRLRSNAQANQKFRVKEGRKKFATFQTYSQSTHYKNHLKGGKSQGLNWLCAPPERNSDKILSLHIPVQCLNSSKVAVDHR